MRNSTTILFLFAFITVSTVMGAPKIVRPFEITDDFKPTCKIDVLVMAGQKKKGVKPANLCSDEVFIRRVYLDVLGILPEAEEVIKFLKDKTPGKRNKLIDSLLKRNDEFAAYWSLKWCDILRVKAEFPINLWPNAVQAYQRWIYDALRKNMPYDRFVSELLTTSGSNFRSPQVNFYRAVQGKKPETIAAAVALTFMGTRYERWPEPQQAEMAKFFSRIACKGTAEWKEEIIFMNPEPLPPLNAAFPDGTVVNIQSDQDPRKVFAAWLITPGNPWFARNIVNRVWSWLLGRGIIHPADDIRLDNPPVNPELLSYLEKELVKSGYDLKHIYRIILKSRTYQQSCVPRDNRPEAAALFAFYPVRQLDAEVLADALNSITGGEEEYSSAIPEPFTFVPKYNPSKTLADGSITSPFLELFGRPPRDTGLESERNNQPSEPQRLHMLNSSHIRKKLDRGLKLRKLMRTAGNNRRKRVETLYLHIMSRYPTEAEMTTIAESFRSLQVRPQDLVWALINSKEFLSRH